MALSHLLLLAVVVGLFASLPLVSSGSTDWFTSQARLSENDICIVAGKLGGCSACTALDFCVWAPYRDKNSVSFYCYTPAVAREYGVMDAPYMCSADPAKEPPISLPLGIEFVGGNREDGGKIPLSRAQDMWSYAINDDMVELPVKPFFVDRSSFGGRLSDDSDWAGNAYEVEYMGKTVPTDCIALTSPELFNPKALFDGQLLTDRDKFCVKGRLNQLNIVLSNNCPQYGKPRIGYCASFVNNFDSQCDIYKSPANGDTHQRPSPVVAIDMNLAQVGAYVVPDGTAHCIDYFELEPSGRMQKMMGLEVPTDLLATDEHAVYYSEHISG